MIMSSPREILNLTECIYTKYSKYYARKDENGILIDKVSVIQKHIHVLQNFAKCSG